MTHIELLEKHGADRSYIELARGYTDIAAMVAASNDIDFLQWTLWLIRDPRARVGIAAHIVRYTPIGGGRTVYDLLTDVRSRHALDVCDRYSRWVATEEELKEARANADAAFDAAYDAPSAAATRSIASAAFGAAAAVSYTSYAAAAAAAAAYASSAAITFDAAAWQSDYIQSLDWNELTGEQP